MGRLSIRGLKTALARYISTMRLWTNTGKYSPQNHRYIAQTPGVAFLIFTMSRRLFSNSLLRGIFDVFREIQMLTTGPHQLPDSEITLSPLHLPDVGEPAQYLIEMGLRPALARRLSSVYMDIVARYRQVFESYFRRAIQGSCHHQPEHYCDIFVVQFKGTIQVLKFQFMSAAWVWLCRAGLSSTLFWPQCIDVRIPVYATLCHSL
jgi:hypothetical protein